VAQHARMSRHWTWDRNWGSTIPGGGCRYELSVAHARAELMCHGTVPAPEAREAGCLEEFQQNILDRSLLVLRSNHAELMFSRAGSQDRWASIYCKFKFLTSSNTPYCPGSTSNLARAEDGESVPSVHSI
jgi:hypothetical protein